MIRNFTHALTFLIYFSRDVEEPLLEEQSPLHVATAQQKPPPKPPTTLCNSFGEWTEDGIGLTVALLIYLGVLAISESGIELSGQYASDNKWPLGAAVSGFLVAYAPHYGLGKAFNLEAYAVVILIAVVARAIGDYTILSHSGLSASLWGIVIGICGRTFCGLDLKAKGVVSGEYFVKVGVTLLAMDFTSIVSIGLPGLMIAWGDTIIVLAVGVLLNYKFMNFNIKDSIVIAGATCICGSSAATALSSSLHDPSYKDETCKTIIALMGLFNAPLMPLMPLGKTAFGLNPAVVGAWIGGSIDSTGQVTASAQMGGDAVLKTAVIIKMAQNILIGPLCLLFTGTFQKSFQPSILVSKFPLFVVGFLLTSAVTTAFLHSDAASSDIKDTLISNSWYLSEWFTLIGFACIGLEIDLRAFVAKKNAAQHHVLVAYLMIQTFDLFSTFGWSYLMFHNKHLDDDDCTDC